ncbi:MAG: flagellar basal body P-ring protein FlgI [Alphaproteobacteria bacterium]|nr:flagellar basal body P-ring protein FlgI [Alphaproteobacteria bacterium]MCB9930417.1 flagellar basal body P-ring protein FlgI [Alphaproteobacteria bacterium]
MRRLAGLLALLALTLWAHAAPVLAAEARIKDLVDFQGVRGNDLVGYGLVVGLNGTGDSLRNAPFTEEALANVLERLGVNVQGENFRPRNVAAVLVTASLPPFARAGSRVDVTVSAIGDAKSLLGGALVMTPLNAADGKIYAVAQGALIAGGESFTGAAASVTKGVPTAGVIPNGARVEREVEFALAELGSIRLALRDPDFTTANRIQHRINRHLGQPLAKALDPGTVELSVPPARRTAIAGFIAEIEGLPVRPDQPARVVVDQRSGTIVMGADVRISTVAVSQGNLTVRITEQPTVSQPNPFAAGQTVVVPRTGVDVQTGNTKMAVVEGGTNLAELVSGLNALGIGPRDMIDILSAIKTAGALHAELIVR